MKAITWLLLVLLSIIVSSLTVKCIVVNSSSGRDNSSCLDGPAIPCKTLGYVIISAPSLNNSQIVLFGDQVLNETLTVTRVTNLTIRSGGNTSSSIKCSHPSHENDIGSGLVLISVSRITVSSVRFEACGTLQYSTTVRSYESVKYRSAVYIINSTDISFINTTFYENIGRGLSMHDVDGKVHVSKSLFKNNMVPKESNLLFGGGSIYLEFTYCSPGVSNCDHTSNSHNKGSRYMIENCTFEGNRASNREAQNRIVQFRILPGSDGNNAGQGGGLHVIIKGSSFNNTVKVENCIFYNNSAVWGGGIDAIFLDTARNNTFHVNNCTFINNLAPDRGGGALQLGFYGADRIFHNSIIVEDTRFVNNSAGWGAAAAFFSSRSQSFVNSSLRFINCVFEGNSASIGAAVHLKPEAMQSLYEGSAPTAVFCNCNFTENRILETGTFLNIADDSTSQHVLESGTVDIESLEIDFLQYVSFTGNRGSAIVANSAQVNVLENTKVEFVDNTATNGGAMALLGFSVLELYPQSEVVFDSNQASELGGAVYATSPHQTEFIFSHKCFISFSGMFFHDPDRWNTTITFIDNSAKYGDVIFTDSVLPCAKQIGQIVTNITAAFQWKAFRITPEIGQYTIATSPASINFSLPPEISPGEMINIHPTSLDDLGQYIPTAFKATLVSLGGGASTNPFIADDGHLQISGEPGTVFNLTLLTQTTRHVSATKSGRLGNCPLGFTLISGSTCVCSTDVPQKNLVGVTACDLNGYRGLLQIGYWIGCTENKATITGICPLNYCNHKNSSALVIPRTCEELKQSSVCTDNRRGKLCGECRKDYSFYFHSDRLRCGECPHGALGILAYLAAEILPLSILFIGVMMMHLKITSGLAQSFLLFAQTFFLINQAPSLRPISDASSNLLRVHTFILGFFNLYFFHLDEMSFCLWKGATALDVISFRFTTTLSCMLLLALFILLAKNKSLQSRILEKYLSYFNKILKMLKKRKLAKNSVVHGISTFLILSYTQYTATSFLVLNATPLYGEGGIRLESVVYLQGNVEYFGVDHLPYAIPAVLVLVFLSLPPPLLLISYPLLWKIKAKLRRNVETENDTTVWPIRKLLPLIDSFQGVFKDNFRMFAGLLFLWKVILSSIFTLTTNLTEFFLLTEIALLCIFTLHTLVKPYKKQLHNIVDGLMLANMAVINSLKWYTSVPTTGDVSSQVIEFLVAIQLILLYIPLICLVGYAVYWLLKRFNIVPAKLKCWLAEEESMKQDTETAIVRRKATLKRQGTCPDEDLFSRAAELNTATTVVTCTEAGVEIETGRTTLTTLGTD